MGVTSGCGEQEAGVASGSGPPLLSHDCHLMFYDSDQIN